MAIQRLRAGVSTQPRLGIRLVQQSELSQRLQAGVPGPIGRASETYADNEADTQASTNVRVSPLRFALHRHYQLVYIRDPSRGVLKFGDLPRYFLSHGC